MYAVILVIWTATTGGAAYVLHEMEMKYQSVEACQEAAMKQKVEKFKCIAKKG